MLVDLAVSRIPLQAKGAEARNPLAKPGCSADASHSPIAAFPLDERFVKVQAQSPVMSITAPELEMAKL